MGAEGKGGGGGGGVPINMHGRTTGRGGGGVKSCFLRCEGCFHGGV